MAAVYHRNLDHTSVLKCIARRFGTGSYSDPVDGRPVGDIWEALELDAPRGDDADPPPPPSDAGSTRYLTSLKYGAEDYITEAEVRAIRERKL